jgi:EAL domain-containing protein (putative c-di-GMP-specific phosphodiesterase class I)/GGDEF domain-containing protein
MQSKSMIPRTSEVSFIHNHAQFLAAVARRLTAMPAPFPDLAVISVVLPGLSALRQTYGTAAAEQLLDRIYSALQRFSPESVIGRSTDAQFAMTYEFDSTWIDVTEIAAEVRAVIDGASNDRQLSAVAPANLGTVVHSGHTARGTALDLATELLRQSDLAVQSASRQGQNGFVLYSAEEDARIRSATVLDQSLRRAVARGDFCLHYQPVVDLRSLEMVGMEGLVRWNSAGGVLRGPNDFIPAAEASGLIVQIGAAVVDIALRQLDAWSSDGWSPPRLAINVAAAQLQDPGFRDAIVRAVSSGRIRPADLELEITERTLITWSSATRRLFDELREMGIGVSLDDFGTGYSSLQYLRDIPIGKLKIDRTFVRNITVEPRDAALVKMIVDLGGALGFEIVAEGIEEVGQAEKLLECGCTIGQGYLYSRPQPAANLPGLQSMLRQRRLSASSGDRQPPA